MNTITVTLFNQDFPAWLTAHGVPDTSGLDLDVLQAGIRQLTGAWLAQLNAAYRAAAETPSCRVCGCSEDRACPGGCCWVPDPRMLGDLCSACAQLLHENGMLTDPLDVPLDPFDALGQMTAARPVPVSPRPVILHVLHTLRRSSRRGATHADHRHRNLDGRRP